jgi:hypothetical protein
VQNGALRRVLNYPQMQNRRWNWGHWNECSWPREGTEPNASGFDDRRRGWMRR